MERGAPGLGTGVGVLGRVSVVGAEMAAVGGRPTLWGEDFGVEGVHLGVPVWVRAEMRGQGWTRKGEREVRRPEGFKGGYHSRYGIQTCKNLNVELCYGCFVVVALLCEV